jgi:ATP adenylyltransferase
MCVPYDHQARLQDLTQATRYEMMDMVNRCIEVLQSLYHPDGFNVGLNLGEMAGAGVAEHLHTHIVPRWSGDTNFMSSIGDTRVLPEDLETSYQRIKAAWEEFD